METGRPGSSHLFLTVIAQSGPGRLGTPLHGHLINRIVPWYLNRDCNVEPEQSHVVNGIPRFVDMAVTWPDGKAEAVEVETEVNDRAVENIKKNLAIGFDLISVITPNRKVREAIRRRVCQELAPCDMARIRFPAMSTYT